MGWQVAQVAPAPLPILGPLFHTPARQATEALTASQHPGSWGCRGTNHSLPSLPHGTLWALVE